MWSASFDSSMLHDWDVLAVGLVYFSVSLLHESWFCCVNSVWWVWLGVLWLWCYSILSCPHPLKFSLLDARSSDSFSLFFWLSQSGWNNTCSFFHITLVLHYLWLWTIFFLIKQLFIYFFKKKTLFLFIDGSVWIYIQMSFYLFYFYPILFKYIYFNFFNYIKIFIFFNFDENSPLVYLLLYRKNVKTISSVDRK